MKSLFPSIRLARTAASLAALITLGVGTAAHAQGAMHGAGPGHAMQGPGGMHAAHGRMHGGDGAGMEMRGFERMLDRVQATPEQRAQIRKIMESARADLRAGGEASRAQRGKMAELLAQPQIDAAAVEAARQQQVARHDAASKRVTQAMVEAGRVLTPEQRQKLAAHTTQMHEMMQRHRHERRALEAPKS